MKAFILKTVFVLCLMGVVGVSAQSTTKTTTTTTTKAKTTATTTSKSTATTKKTTTTASKTPAKKTTTTTTKAKTNTEVVKVGTTTSTPPPPVNVTGGIPAMKFDKKTIDFGKIKTGDKPEVVYNFTNTGNAPLDIDIVSGCDCTELEWTRTTVQPGEKGFVKAVFNSVKAEAEDHKKPLKKYVDIVLKQIHPKSGGPIAESLTFDVFIVD
ncbi:MAG: DUF1573 domain-containing protein [Saprospiraceae bacterium]|nr:DUF1573 domain-containing protein [Saprospiraceae bacterium]